MAISLNPEIIDPKKISNSAKRLKTMFVRYINKKNSPSEQSVPQQSVPEPNEQKKDLSRLLFTSTVKYDDIFDDQNQIKDSLKDIILKEFASNDNIHVLNFVGRKILPSVIYYHAKCLFSQCVKVNFTIKLNREFHNSYSLSANVVGETNILSHGNEKHSRNLRGSSRIGIKDLLDTKAASSVRVHLINKKDKTEMSFGNYNDIYSKDVLRKARSEKLGEFDLHSDDYLDVYFKQQSLDYILHTSSPFTVVMMSPSQIQVLKWLSDIDLQIDATGKVIRKPVKPGKQVLYYAAVTNTPKGILPLFDMATVDQASCNIETFLLTIRSTIQKSGIKWPPFERISTDFSFAILHAVSHAFNRMSLIDCVNQCYCSTMGSEVNKITLCSSHFIKMILRKLATTHKTMGSKHFIASCVGSLITESNFEKFSSMAKALLVVVKSPLCGNLYKTNMKSLR